MKYISYSEYRGSDFHNLLPVAEDEPHEGWGVEGGVGVYARYVESWDTPEVLEIKDWKVFYSKELSGREW